MDGLLKLVAIILIFYMLGWLSKKNQQRVEKWFDRIVNLFNKKRRENENQAPDKKIVEQKSKLQKAFNNPTAFDQFLGEFKISPKEWEIIELVCDGYTNKEIDNKLYISLATVKDYLYKIFQKTGVKNRVQLTNFIRNTIDDANKQDH